jgi:hypothetical protein
MSIYKTKMILIIKNDRELHTYHNDNKNAFFYKEKRTGRDKVRFVIIVVKYMQSYLSKGIQVNSLY